MSKKLSFVFIIIITISSLIFGIFSCAKKKEKKVVKAPFVTLDFMWWGAEAETSSIKEIIKKFQEANPNIKVNFSYVHWTNYWDKLDTKIAAGVPPDVSRLIWQKIGNYSEKEVFLDLTPYFDKDFPSKFIPILWTAVQYNNKIIGIPFVTDTIALIYNKKYINLAEIKIPQKLESAWTWSEFEKISKKIKEKSKCKYAVSFDKSGHRIPIFFYQNGGSLTSKDYKYSNLNTSEVISAIEWLKKMHEKGYAIIDTITGSLDNDDAFIQGLVAFNYGGMWMMKYYDKYLKGNWDVTYLPKNKFPATCFGGNCLVAYNKTKYPKEAWMLISYITNKENMKKFAEENIFIPARIDIIADYGIYQEKASKFIQQYEAVPKHFAKENTLPAFSDFYVYLEEIVSQVVTNQISPKDGVKLLNQKFEELLKK